MTAIEPNWIADENTGHYELPTDRKQLEFSSPGELNSRWYSESDYLAQAARIAELEAQLDA